MLTPINWIKKFVPDLQTSDQEYADKMTLSGSKVETYKRLNSGFDKVVVGKIIKLIKHPDADKLVVCKVDIGNSAPIQIVTGATNVFEGALVPVVLAGGFVSNADKSILKIKKGKLRGEESDGMFCSIYELGSTKDFYPEACVDGIYIFEENYAPGTCVDTILGMEDTVFEYEITSNRVDCFSIYGIAREVAATYNLPFKRLEISSTNSKDVNKYISVEIKNNKLCKRYCARVVKNIKIEPSPRWLRQALASVGIRPINNIVDITNYVMTELGQPMHAFDLDTIADGKIIIDNADIKSFKTLDDIERTLDSSILMINDAKKPLAIAGIMGGENSKITDGAKTLLLEAACFDGTNIRLSSKKIGLRTESSTKFEKGLDPSLCLDAINRACDLIVELGAGEAVEGVIDIGKYTLDERKIPFNVDKCNKFLGSNIEASQIKKYFDSLELKWNLNESYVTVPSFRQDLERFVDLVEEVARFYGYDNIDTTLPKMSTEGKYSEKLILQEKISNILTAYGFCETMTYSFEGPSVFNKLLIDEQSTIRRAIEIKNPLGEEYSIMRTLPFNGMLTSLATNFNNRNSNTSLYEFANTYKPKALPLVELPKEKIFVTLGRIGGDFFELKGVIEAIIRGLSIKEKLTYERANDLSYLHPGRCANISHNGLVIASLGEVHPLVMKNYNLGDKAYIGCIDFDFLLINQCNDNKYKHIPRFPASSRDISLLLNKNQSVNIIEDAIEKYSGKLLEKYYLFDLYEGDKLGENKKSVAYKISFRSDDRTLVDDEINKIIAKILTELEKNNITLRK